MDIPSGYSMPTIWGFGHVNHKYTWYMEKIA